MGKGRKAPIELDNRVRAMSPRSEVIGCGVNGGDMLAARGGSAPQGNYSAVPSIAFLPAERRDGGSNGHNPRQFEPRRKAGQSEGMAVVSP
jgi:hypothetical protein